MKMKQYSLVVFLCATIFCSAISFSQKKIPMTKEEYYNNVLAPQRGLRPIHKTTSAVSTYADRKRSVLNIGNVWARISNAATLGYDRWGLCYEFPARSGITYRWTMAPMIAAMKRDSNGVISKKFVASGTRGASRYSEEEFQPLPGYDSGEEIETENIGIAFSDIPESWPSEWPTGPMEVPLDASGRFPSPSFPGIVNGTVKAPREAYFVVTDNDAENGNKPYPMNIRVDLWALQYDDILNRNFIIYKQLVRNIGTDTLFNVYIGIHDDPDCPEQGASEWTDDYAALIRLGDDVPVYTSREDTLLANFTYLWDGDDKAEGFISKNVGWVGLKFLETPNDPLTGQPKGVTTFQVFEYSNAPQTEATEYDQLTAGIQPPHNVSPHNGDVTRTPNSYGPDVTYVVASGPFTLAPGQTLNFAFATIHGSNKADLFNSAMLCQLLYNANYESAESPPEPSVNAVSGDKKITLYWDDRSEKGVYRRSDGSVDHVNDRLTLTNAFEGYKIFKSTDQGITWGEAIRDVNGAFKYWRALQTYDLVNGITGESTHPLGRYYLLGNDAGLQHKFIDYDVNNGYEYWYAVVAYDHDDGVIPPLENSIKSDPYKDGDNTIAVTPYASPIKYTPSSIGRQIHTMGRSPIDSFPLVEYVPEKITGHKYRITFDTTNGLRKYTIKDLNTDQYARTTDTVKHYRNPITNEIDSIVFRKFELHNVPMDAYSFAKENLPLFDGLYIDIHDDTVFGIHQTNIFPPSSISSLQVQSWEIVQSGNSGMRDDFEIRFGDTSLVALKTNQKIYFKAPFQVWNTTTNIQVVGVIDVDTSNHSRIDSTTLNFKNEGIYIVNRDYHDTATSNATANSATWNFSFGTFAQKGLRAKPSDYNYKLFFDSTSVIPTTFLVTVSIVTKQLLSENDEYEFSTSKGIFAKPDRSTLEEITVVPNPYVVSSPYEKLQFGIERVVQFHKLPKERCTIRIFNIAGDLVQTLVHDNGTPIDSWNLKTYNGQEVAFGIYIFHVQSEFGEYIGKLALIK